MTERLGSWQFSLRWLFGLTAIVALACGLATWAGPMLFCLILVASAGTFSMAFLCPLVGLDGVLDELRVDTLKSLAAGTFLVGGAWLLVVTLKQLTAWLVGRPAPALLVGFAVLVHFCVFGLLIKVLWFDADPPEVVLIMFGTLLLVSIAAVLLAA
jgi:hypothetical protein